MEDIQSVEKLQRHSLSLTRPSGMLNQIPLPRTLTFHIRYQRAHHVQLERRLRSLGVQQAEPVALAAAAEARARGGGRGARGGRAA